MAKRPETRRKVPNYFGDYHDLSLRWGGDGWSVGYYCQSLRRWDWESLEAERIGKKLEAEAKAAAVKLMRASAARREEEVSKALAATQQLRRNADDIELGRKDWSAI